MIIPIHKDFCFFKLKGDDEIHVAVPLNYVKVIENEILNCGSISEVSSDKTVRGVFLEEVNGELEFDEDAQQNDIVINQLIIL